MSASDPTIRQFLAPRGTAPPTPLLCSLLTPIEPDFDPSVDSNSLHELLQLEVTNFRANGFTPVHVHRSPSLEAILIDSSRTPLRCAHPWFDPMMNPHQQVTHPDIDSRRTSMLTTSDRSSFDSRFRELRLQIDQAPDAHTDKAQQGLICPSSQRNDPDLSIRCIPRCCQPRHRAHAKHDLNNLALTTSPLATRGGDRTSLRSGNQTREPGVLPYRCPLSQTRR